MKAISTKYVSAANTKPSRIKASAEGVKSVFYTIDDGHEAAARDFAARNGWGTDLASGGLSADVWVHCFVDNQRLPFQPTQALAEPA